MFRSLPENCGLPSYFMGSTTMQRGEGLEEIPLDRALLASKNHREAEKRRRERIKSHLDRLRMILACDPKTDKASLLAKTVEHVRDLKQRMSEMTNSSISTRIFPSDNDEIFVMPKTDGQRSIFEASICCDDRNNLFSETTETLRSIHMKTLRAEIVTLGGRVRNVMVLAREKNEEYIGDTNDDNDDDDDISFLKEALLTLVNDSSSSDRIKRRRVMEA